MVKDWDELDPQDGLPVNGPLKGRLSTIKVGVRPPDIRLVDRVNLTLSELKEKRVDIPRGTGIALGSMDGFLQINDISRGNIDGSSIIRLIEFDPTRGVFLAGGDGEADIRSEMSWYLFRAFKETVVILFTPDKEVGEMPENSRERVDLMLDMIRRSRENDSVTLLGMKVERFSSWEGMCDHLENQLKSQ